MNSYFRDDFELDWCISALNHVRNELKTTRGSRWLVFGQQPDSFMEAVVRFLWIASSEMTLDFSITILVGSEFCQTATQMFPFAAVKNIDLQESPIPAEYCVYCGYAQKSDTCVDSRLTRNRAEKFFTKSAQPLCRFLCISSARVYNTYPYPIAAAEGEFLHETTSSPQISARYPEQLTRQSQTDYVILRPGIILAAGLEMESPVSALLNQLIHGNPDPVSAQAQYSLVYMTDFLTALVLAAITPRVNTAYNVSSEQNTASLMHICQLYLEQTNRQTQWELKVVTEPNCPSFALCGSKLAVLGWQPLVDLKTMLTMEIKARSGLYNGIYFAEGHQGKLPVIHAQLVNILCEVDRICKKHDITYFLAGGTLLGAARHQGFIPWDDDLDVMMLRRDYERFIAIAREELPDTMFLQTPVDEPGDHYLISKIRLNDTVFSSEYLTRFPDLHNGIFVDIIAQDYTANSTLGQKLHLKLSLLARGLVFKKWSGQSATIKGKLYVFFDFIKWLFPISTLEKFQHWALTLFDEKANRKYLYDSMGINISKGSYPAQWLSGTVNLMFEGHSFPAPVEYEKYLHYLYGDYQQLVPITQRTTTHEVVLTDLGPYAESSQILD